MLFKNSEILLTQQQAAEYLSVSASSLATWRYNNKHQIPYIKFGHTVRYRKTDLDEWIFNHSQHLNKGEFND